MATIERRRRARSHPDPRLILSRTQRLPFHMAARARHRPLLDWLDPSVPLMFLFSGDDDTGSTGAGGSGQLVGVPRLTVLSARALHECLQASLTAAKLVLKEHEQLKEQAQVRGKVGVWMGLCIPCLYFWIYIADGCCSSLTAWNLCPWSWYIVGGKTDVQSHRSFYLLQCTVAHAGGCSTAHDYASLGWILEAAWPGRQPAQGTHTPCPTHTPSMCACTSIHITGRLQCKQDGWDWSASCTAM